jgi:hypothetical protein
MPPVPPERTDRPDGTNPPGQFGASGKSGQSGQRPTPGGADPAGRWALALGSAALLLMIVFPPAAPLPAAAALVVGVRARRRARRAARTAGRGTLAGVIMGSVGLAISIPLATTQIMLWSELNRYLDCRETANTITDEQGCRDTFLREVENKFNLRQGSLERYDIPM